MKLYSILKGSLLALTKVLRCSSEGSYSVCILLAMECDLMRKLYLSFITLVKLIVMTG